MKNTTIEEIKKIRERQHEFFATGQTLSYEYRKDALLRLKTAVLKWEKPMSDALQTDLHKCYEESYMTEISIVLSEIDKHLKGLRRWMRPEKVMSPLKMFPSRSQIVAEPLGRTLIIAPWNYPVHLLLVPLVGAISSGCTAVLKPSPYVPNVSKVIETMISETFDAKYIAVAQGNREVNSALLSFKWGLIFFTGSPKLGRVVMSEAAKNLTPVVLELGGKSPCIVDRTADIKLAAKRIAWGKLLNAGQTCIAPDYLMIHRDVKDAFLEALKREFIECLPPSPDSSRYFARIVNDVAFERLSAYLKEGKVIFGGETDPESRYISPTILDEVPEGARVLEEEIFGPIFPVLTFDSLSQAIERVNSRPKPLALYYFGDDGDTVIARTSSGGCCINDCVMHIANENLPFGGVGESGMGSYHGKRTFDVFTHHRAVVTSRKHSDLPFRYMPYKWFDRVKKLM